MNQEEQKIIRYRVATETLLLTLGLIFLNGLLKTAYLWAVPQVEMIFLLGIPTMYFAARTMLQGADPFAGKEHSWTSIMIFGGLALINGAILISKIESGNFIAIENGMLQNDVIQIGFILVFAEITGLLFWKNSRKN